MYTINCHIAGIIINHNDYPGKVWRSSLIDSEASRKIAGSDCTKLHRLEQWQKKSIPTARKRIKLSDR